mmetsp:Transcript_23228/g.58706  ORF Transcript_23228/g.58706 Transcript_23228/m.58706 type:complete len:289 (-) Transcript_23228:1588-2454(-)
MAETPSGCLLSASEGGLRPPPVRLPAPSRQKSHRRSRRPRSHRPTTPLQHSTAATVARGPALQLPGTFASAAAAEVRPVVARSCASTDSGEAPARWFYLQEMDGQAALRDRGGRHKASQCKRVAFHSLAFRDVPTTRCPVLFQPRLLRGGWYLKTALRCARSRRRMRFFARRRPLRSKSTAAARRCCDSSPLYSQAGAGHWISVNPRLALLGDALLRPVLRHASRQNFHLPRLESPPQLPLQVLHTLRSALTSGEWLRTRALLRESCACRLWNREEGRDPRDPQYPSP